MVCHDAGHTVHQGVLYFKMLYRASAILYTPIRKVRPSLLRRFAHNAQRTNAQTRNSAMCRFQIPDFAEIGV